MGRWHAQMPDVTMDVATTADLEEQGGANYTALSTFSPTLRLYTYGLSIPIFVGISSSERLEVVNKWIHTHAGGGQQFFGVNCTVEENVIQGVINCHRAVARAALDYFGGRPGLYIDLEDNCHPTLRIDWQLAYDAAHELNGHREWKFIHLSRFPAPFGVLNPHLPLTGSLYYKTWTVNELAQAMLCTTEFATWITQSFNFTEPYDDMLMPWQKYVVYPSLFQRWTETELATRATKLFAAGSPFAVLRNISFQPSIYLLIEALNVFGIWLVLATIIACILARQERHACCQEARVLSCHTRKKKAVSAMNS